MYCDECKDQAHAEKEELIRQRDEAFAKVDELKKILEEVWITHDEIVAAVKPILPPATLKLWQDACKLMREVHGS